MKSWPTTLHTTSPGWSQANWLDWQFPECRVNTGECPELQLHNIKIAAFTPPSPNQIDRFLSIVDEGECEWPRQQHKPTSQLQAAGGNQPLHNGRCHCGTY
ncbi:uncharacterized protein KZ484_013311 [Pholidichthys leucotaenia]